MISRFACTVLATGLILGGARNVDAQILSKPLEIGMDGQLLATTGDDSSTSFTIPASLVRIGLQLTDHVSIEPAFSLDYVTSGGDHAMAYGIGVGLLWNFRTDRTKLQWYGRPFVTMSGLHGSGDVGNHQVQLGAGVGIRVPLTSTLSFRTAANVGHWLEHGNNSSETDFGLTFGLSVWTK